jgi:hypothetical protein
VAKLNDADADAFFRQGDEGTYAGGPGDSIPTGVVNVFDDLDEDVLPRPTREQIERRDRYKRWVTGLVSALGVSALLAGAVRVADTRTDDVPKMDTGAAQGNVAAQPPAPPPAAPLPPVAPTEPVAAAPQVVAAVPAEAPPPQVVAAAPAEAPPPVAKPAPSTQETVRTKPPSTDRETKAAPRSPKTAVVTPPATPKVAPSLVHSSPPTANFPD